MQSLNQILNNYFSLLILKNSNQWIGLCTLIFLTACQNTSENQKTLFQKLPSSITNIDFENILEYTEEFNAYVYRNFYNGAGVVLGDINNDGLVDIFFCGNLVDNKLYLNKGNFEFEDITQKAGVACPNVWTTGASFADVNGDGWLDLYVCKSGDPEGDNRHNELFINNQDGTFTEQAEKYGIADLGLSNHAVFFDYDKDGDLDCYLLNNSFRPVGGYDLIKDQREIRDTLGGNKLYRNELVQGEAKFTDVSEAAGIYGSSIGFGLGVTVGDVNKDGWQDIFVSNDFFERDYLYINNQDGTFSEELEEQMREISMGSMGADMADINNDGYPEIFVTDMLPDGNRRVKTKMQFEDWDKYQRNVREGYYHQFTRNVLQLNNGNNTFSEIGRFAGVHATDWSWGALMMDMDNDGWKDIFVANGIGKDLMDQDYVNFYATPENIRALINEKKQAITTLMDNMPSEKLPNYAFINNQDLTFSNLADSLGLGDPSFSNGSAYGDLDNDGDLDLVVNNADMEAFVYENTATEKRPNHKYLAIDLKGNAPNTFAFGTQIIVHSGDQIFYQEQLPMRGFQSNVDHRVHFGLGEISQVDSIVIKWNSGKQTVLKNIKTNQLLTIEEAKANDPKPNKVGKIPPVFRTVKDILNHQHQENIYSDFNKERLIYHMLSSEGPKVAKGDVNNDGRADLYIGGAKGQAGSLWLQRVDGQFQKARAVISAFEKDKDCEDVDSELFDANGDGYLDLYVTSGGNEGNSFSPALRDRLYINKGRGQFIESEQVLPAGRYENTSCVQAADYDGDGDQDLFVGVRLRLGLYGVPNNGYILQNDGKGNFRNVSPQIAPDLKDLGMITDAVWEDIDGDQDLDLIIVGEWMPIVFFTNDNGIFKKTQFYSTEGWWNCIKAADLDKDGDMDLVIGNHGLNSRFKSTIPHPLSMYINDYDRNGTAEQVLCMFDGDTSYPMALRHDLVMQLPVLKKRYLKYASYRDEKITDIFPADLLGNSVRLEANELRTIVLLNEGNGQFTKVALPTETQLSPTYGLLIEDFDKDGNLDILTAGNFYRAKPETGKYDASYGTFLKGDGKGNFEVVLNKEVGLKIKGEVRDLVKVKTAKGDLIVVVKNDDLIQVIEY